MENNEKLLEAARMIQDHCQHTFEGERCIFSEINRCNGCQDCVLGYGGYIPIDWDIPLAKEADCE